MMTRHVKTVVLVALALVAGVRAGAQQEPVDAAANAKIRDEGLIDPK
jgi:hypothetical protein